MNSLSLDYGRSKVGLAFSEGFLSQPLTVFKNNPKLLQKIRRLCQEKLIDQIVIGLPEGELQEEIKNFGQKLEKFTSLPVAFEPETLTTKEAIAKMIAAGKKKKVRQEKVDAFAAALILQSFIDKNV